MAEHAQLFIHSCINGHYLFQRALPLFTVICHHCLRTFCLPFSAVSQKFSCSGSGPNDVIQLVVSILVFIFCNMQKQTKALDNMKQEKTACKNTVTSCLLCPTMPSEIELSPCCVWCKLTTAFEAHVLHRGRRDERWKSPILDNVHMAYKTYLDFLLSLKLITSKAALR